MRVGYEKRFFLFFFFPLGRTQWAADTGDYGREKGQNTSENWNHGTRAKGDTCRELCIARQPGSSGSSVEFKPQRSLTPSVTQCLSHCPGGSP